MLAQTLGYPWRAVDEYLRIGRNLITGDYERQRTRRACHCCLWLQRYELNRGRRGRRWRRRWRRNKVSKDIPAVAWLVGDWLAFASPARGKLQIERRYI